VRLVADVAHVVVLMLENRSFDHLLGLLLDTYDEHGGLYDHVPPPTGVPSPGGRTSRVGIVQRTLLHRKASTFDFTMLGPRVPAVVISPRVPAGTIDTQTHGITGVRP
jgi:phospholipase C